MKKNYTISFSSSTFWKVIVPFIAVAIAAGGLIGVIVIDKKIMPHIVHIDRGMVTVPSLVGLSWEDARQELFNQGSARLPVNNRHPGDRAPTPADLL